MPIHVEDVVVGTPLPAQSFTVTRLDLIKYCGASGDFNVIHWNERIAKSVGLPDVISHGMLTMARAVRVVTDWVGDPSAVIEYGVRMTRPVVVPDGEVGSLVEVSGVVAVVNDDGTVRVDLTATFAGETVLAKAQAVVRLG
jgi:acyl dehydratase